MDALRIALIGLGRAGRTWLRAIRACPGLDLVAIGDQSPETSKATADECSVPAYSDYRQLLVEHQPQAAVFAVPPFVAEPYLPIAAQNGTSVLCEAPYAKSFECAARAVDVFRDTGLPLVVASRWRFDEDVRDALAAASGAGWRLGHATIYDDPGSDISWRGDSQRAGGGVLLDAAYEAADLMLELWDLPGDVSAQLGRLGPLAGGRFDTEDTAALLCRCDGGGSFSIMAAWRAGPRQSEIRLLGASGQWTLTPSLLQHVAPNGEMTTIRRPDGAELHDRILRNFAATVRERSATYVGSAADQLGTAALLEAAYHSARTHAAESPSEVYELAGRAMPRRIGRMDSL